MAQNTYAVIVFWSAEDQAFIARVPELSGCMAHGETRTRAIEQIEIAIENWINTAREIGREIPDPENARSAVDFAEVWRIARRNVLRRLAEHDHSDDSSNA